MIMTNLIMIMTITIKMIKEMMVLNVLLVEISALNVTRKKRVA